MTSPPYRRPGVAFGAFVRLDTASGLLEARDAAGRASGGRDGAEAPAYEDDEPPMADSAKDAAAEIAEEAARPSPRAPANPGFRSKSWR